MTATGVWASRRRCWRSGTGACAKKSCLDPVRHEHRVDVAVAAAVVLLAIALLDEAELLVQRDRSGVPREDVQLELAHTGVAPPIHGGREQRRADSLPPVRLRDH